MAHARTIRVLLVDNDSEDRLLIADLLSSGQRERYELTMAGSYAEGLAAMRAGVFDICLLDYELDGHTGLDIIRSPTCANLDAPIVIISGQEDYDVDLAVMQAGAAEFLPKAELGAALLERVIRYSMRHHESQKKFTYFWSRTTALSGRVFTTRRVCPWPTARGCFATARPGACAVTR